MISARYALPVALLVALALVPTVIHRYLGSTMNDGLRTERIGSVLAGFRSAPSQRNERWGKDVFATENWFERIYRTPGEAEVRLFVARSYDHKRLFHHPELALSYGTDFENASIVRLPGEAEIPVHLLLGRGGPGYAAYVLLYEDGFVEDPILHQLRDSLYALVSARRPMTLFYVAGGNRFTRDGFRGSAAARLLGAAIESFRTQPGGGHAAVSAGS